MNEKVLGIIGGMGPLSDVLFLRLLGRYVSRPENTGDAGYIPLILDGNCARPDRSAFLTGKSTASPLPSLLRSLEKLKFCGADVISMPCNTAHAFFGALSASPAAEGLTLINMPEETANAAARRGVKKVGVLSTDGTAHSCIYEKFLRMRGITVIYPEEESRKAVSELIRRIKNGGDGDLGSFRAELTEAGAELIITGCTELSVALYRHPDNPEAYIDSLSVLAKRSVELCGRIPLDIPYV